MLSRVVPRLCSPSSVLKPVTSTILESGQIADWVIEQMEHAYVFRQEGRCESAAYDISGNTWRHYERLAGKVERKEKLVAKMLENMTEHIHLDDLELNDFDMLVLAKILRFKCDKARLLDVNNNPLIGDMGVAHLVRHVLSSRSGVSLRSLFLSGCGVTDAGVSYLLDALAWPDQSMHILELRKNEITDDGAEELAKILGKPNPGREYDFSLYLNGNKRISDKGVLALAKATMEAQGGLKICLKDIGAELSAEDKKDVMRVTRNRIRF